MIIEKERDKAYRLVGATFYFFFLILTWFYSWRNRQESQNRIEESWKRQDRKFSITWRKLKMKRKLWSVRYMFSSTICKKFEYWNNHTLQNDQLKEALEAERKGMGRYMSQLQKKQLRNDLEYTGKKVIVLC